MRCLGSRDKRREKTSMELFFCIKVLGRDDWQLEGDNMDLDVEGTVAAMFDRMARVDLVNCATSQA